MDRRVRTVALLAILAVLLGGVVVIVVRGDPLPAELLAPLGIITAFLVWAEKESGEQKAKPGEDAAERPAATDRDGET